MLEVKVERCAGIDVGKKFIDVCVLIGPVNRKPAEEVRRFGTNVVDLEALRAWLKEKACTEVVMESTGSYWKPVFTILEGHFKVILANAEQVKVLRGKKTDRKDCRWLAGVAHLYGFLIGVASSILFGRLALFTLKNAVNILYWDQWDFTLHHNRSRSVN